MKITKIAVALLVALAATVAHAETWYLFKSSSGKGKGWSGDDAGPYWKNAEGVVASGALNSTDTYWNKDGCQLRAVNAFAGGDLWIGDLENPNYSTRLAMDGNVYNPNGFLKLAVGYTYHTTASASTYSMTSPIVLSPKDKPFGFESSPSSVQMIIKTSLVGDPGVGLVFGGHYDGSALQYMAATNITLSVTAGLSQYHGDIRVISNQPLISPTVGNVTFVLPPTASDASLEIAGGAEFQINAAGEVSLSNFTAHVGSRLRVYYDSTSKTTSVIRATGTFSIPEEEGIVHVRCNSIPSRTSDSLHAFPLLIVPISQALDASRFEFFSNGDSLAIEDIPSFSVVEDAEAGTKTLVATFLGKGRLVTTDTNYYAGSRDFSSFTSALTEEKAASWADGHLPHELAIYEFGGKSGYGSCIRTPYNRAEDYVFPGVLLRTVAAATFVLADSTRTTVNLDLPYALTIGVVKQKTPTLDGVIYMKSDVRSSAWNGSVFTVASRLVGTGNWSVVGIAGTGSPHSKISFTADNSDWKGMLSLTQNPHGSSGYADLIPGADSGYHQKLVLANPAGLGGALDAFNCKALSLAQFSEIIVTNSLTLANDLNRGIYVTNVALVSVNNNCDFVCNWPITFDGELRKTSSGSGTLSLGGPALFVDAAGELCDDPPEDEIARMLKINSGTVRALSADCANGVQVDVAAAARLALDFNPADADLKRYGFRNVKTDVPFTVDKAINLAILGANAAAVEEARQSKTGYKQGLVTVKTSAAQNVADNLSVTRIQGLRVIREDDAETGTTTFSLYGKLTGTCVIVH